MSSPRQKKSGSASRKKSGPSTSGRRPDIPEGVKRQVRSECGYGCVICGSALYDYEHVIPYAKVRCHRAENLALLCGKHHDEVTRGGGMGVSKEDVAAMRKSPFARQAGFAHQALRAGSSFGFVLGGVAFARWKNVLRVAGHPVIWFEEPEMDGAPVRLNARIFGPDARERCTIVRNEIRARADNWDVEVVGGRITIRDALGDIVLQLVTDPSGIHRIERLQMRVGNWTVTADENHTECVNSVTSQRAGFANTMFFGDETEPPPSTFALNLI